MFIFVSIFTAQTPKFKGIIGPSYKVKMQSKWWLSCGNLNEEIEIEEFIRPINHSSRRKNWHEISAAELKTSYVDKFPLLLQVYKTLNFNKIRLHYTIVASLCILNSTDKSDNDCLTFPTTLPVKL